MLIKCPACKKVQQIPERRKVHCFWCGKPLQAPQECRQAELAVQEARPKVRLEKAPRVNLVKAMPAAPKQKQQLPEQSGCAVRCENVRKKQRVPRFVKDAAFLLMIFPSRMLSTILLSTNHLTLNLIGLLLFGAAIMMFMFSFLMIVDIEREYREPLNGFFEDRPWWYQSAGAILMLVVFAVLIFLLVTAFRLGAQVGDALILLLRGLGVM